MKTLQELQAKFELCVLAVPTSWGGCFSRTVPQLVNSKAKNSSATASITYLSIPAVARGVGNIRNYLENNCLLRNQLGQYIISEPKLEEALKRVEKVNDDIQLAVTEIIDSYEERKLAFRVEMEEYLTKQLGARNGKKVLADVMGHYPMASEISKAAVSLRLDYVSGKEELSEPTIQAIDESKTQDMVQNYQNMVRRAVEPMYVKLGQLINQSVEDKMSERTLTAYRHCITRLREDNEILSNATLESLCYCGFMAINNSDYAEMLLTCIYRMARNAGVEHELPEITRYNQELLVKLSNDDEMPPIEELVTRAKKAMSEKED